MSKASELEAARLAAERLDARCAAISSALAVWDDPAYGLTEIANQLLTEATYISEQRRKGWQSAMREHTAAGRVLEQWARDLAAYLKRDEPPARPPLETIPPPDRHADLDPADGPISAQITSGLLATTGVPKHGAEPRCHAEYPHEPGDRIVRCGKIAGHTMTPGDEPHAEWIKNESDDPEGPIAGGDWGPEWTLPISDRYALGLRTSAAQITSGLLAATDESAPGFRVYDGPITPDAATRVRLAVEAGRGVDEKLDAAFSEPGAAGPTQTHHTNGRIDALSAVASCGSPDGFLGVKRESVTCSDCIAILDCQDKTRARPIGAIAWLSNGESIAFDGAHTDGPVIQVAWNPKGEATVSIPQFSEPGPAPVRQTQVAMTFEAIREHGMTRARGEDHRSVSQFSSFAECGVRYALGDLEPPAWWNVGGTALHYACEWLNREVSTPMQPGEGDPKSLLASHAEHMVETLWTNCLNRSVSETITEHPTVGPDRWRAAKKGAEGYDWWRTNGVDMVRRWITRLTWLYDQGWTIATIDGKPAIELDCPMWIDRGVLDAFGNPSPIKVENILDLAMVRGDTFLIVDAKSGAKPPASTYQLGQYGHALGRILAQIGQAFAVNARIFGAYWLARTDMFSPVDVTKTDTPVDLRELHPWSEIEYLIRTMDVAESQGLYLPNRTSFCGGCGVAGLCPVGPR